MKRMETLRECIAGAAREGRAIGHFNFSNVETFWGIVNAARKLSVPVILGTSEGERGFVGLPQAVALVRSVRKEFGIPIFLNADHTYSLEKVKEAVDAGYDSVIFDGTELPFEENVRLTKKCVAYAKKADPAIVVEGELGFIGKSSKVLEAVPVGVKISEEFLTKPEEAKRFVAETGVSLLAPAVGNIHGMLRGGSDPALHIDRVKAIREAAGVPLVLHGGSGNSNGDFTRAIAAGVAIVHINTEIRVAYKKGLVRGIEENQDEVAPYKYLKEAVLSVERLVEEKLRVFNRIR